MKIKIGIVILLAICVGLFIALFATKKTADEQRSGDAVKIADYSNQVTTATLTIDDLRQVNLMLTNDLAVTRESVTTLSNSLADATGNLTNTKAMLQDAQGRIADLEARNKALDDQASSLTNSIQALNARIAEIQQKLAASDTNNAFLNTELQKQIAQRQKLESQFNDLTAVRAQFKKLRTDEFTARRLQWMREGRDPSQAVKGAQLLMPNSPLGQSVAAGNYDLNVEIGSDGSVNVITNGPAISPDNADQAAARAALLKALAGTNNPAGSAQ